MYPSKYLLWEENYFVNGVFIINVYIYQEINRIMTFVKKHWKMLP